MAPLFGFNGFSNTYIYYAVGAAVLGVGGILAVDAATAKTKTFSDAEILEVTLRDRADTRNVGSDNNQRTRTTHKDVCTVTFRSAADRFVETADLDCLEGKDAYSQLVAAKTDKDKGIRCTLSVRESWLSGPTLTGQPHCD